MKKSNLPIIFLHLLITTTFSSSASADNPTYAAFVHCLTQQNIPPNISSKIVFPPNAPQFPAALHSYIRNRRFNTTATRKPAFIVLPTADPHVSAAVLCSARLRIHLKIRSGGHDYEATSYTSDDDFALLDLSEFRSIRINSSAKTATVGPGATLGELYYHIWKNSKTLAFPAGVCPTVAVGGHIGGAGYGNMLRKHGLTVDHVSDVTIVIGNGSILNRASMGPDLFWALLGGGPASFGVILSYDIELVRVPRTVTVFQVKKYRSDRAAEAVYEYENIVSSMPDELFIRVLIQPVTGPENGKTVRATFIGQYLGRAKNLLNITSRLFPSLGLTNESCHEIPWIQSVLYWDDRENGLDRTPKELLNRELNTASFVKRKSDYVKKTIPIVELEAIFDKVIQLGKVGMVFNSYGGINSRISSNATAFPHREGNLFKIQYSVNWDNEADSEKYVEQSRELYEFMTKYVSENPREAYLNYRDLDIGVMPARENSYEIGKVYGEKYFKDNFRKLVSVKTKVDPDNFFRNEQSIPTWGKKRL
ncbi:FAD-binding Berberine family protein [Striga hermonthica]|uniref:FAD-binding Berberine family protein n=1 Tax=Striga hermonthica TaxID=68872 RepID=A0A9N7N4K0_STRHE|nr:FAD-binding Berberine family protein [Striga hermonthica]